MVSRRMLLRTPWWPFVVLVAVAIAGGLLFNTVHARGRIISATTAQPVADVRFVAYGARQYPVDINGYFDIPDLPRGARLTVIAPGFNRKEFDAADTEVRLVVGVVNFQVTTRRRRPASHRRRRASVTASCSGSGKGPRPATWPWPRRPIRRPTC